MSTLYGSLTNRFEENKNYLGREIRVGDDITEYFYSDCHCYYVTRVINQKNIFVKPYQVCADHSQPGGEGHQDWLYFKTCREMQAYLNKCIDDELITYCSKTNLDEIKEPAEQEWSFRYGHWNIVNRYNLDGYEKALDTAKKECSKPDDIECVKRVARFYFRVTDEELEKVLNGQEVVKYQRIKQGISFGVRNYYYDWEF